MDTNPSSAMEVGQDPPLSCLLHHPANTYEVLQLSPDIMLPEERQYHDMCTGDCDDAFLQTTDISNPIDCPDPYTRPTLQSITVPPIAQVLPPTTVPKPIAPHPLQCLYLTICTVNTYHKMHRSAAPPPCHCAHIDGGAMATTTHQLDLLYYYHEYTTPESMTVPLLHVADADSYCPCGIGLL